MRLDPQGKFYLRRPFRDDISENQRAPEPLTAFDFLLPVIRTVETIAVGIKFVEAMGCKPKETVLAFLFRWFKLQGRELASWVEPGRIIAPYQTSYQDRVVSYVDVPLDTPVSAISDYVSQVLTPLFEAFNGFSLNKSVVEDLTSQVINRRL